MPRKISPEQAEHRAKLAELQRLKAEQRQADAPIRESRRKLTQRLNGLLSKLRKHNSKLRSEVHHNAYSQGLFGLKIARYEAFEAEARSQFNATLVDLLLFDSLH